MRAEWQLEFMRNLRPVFAKDVPGHVIGDAITNAAGRGAKSARVSGMVKIAQRFGTYRAKPFRIVWHELAGIALSYKPVRQRVAQPRLRRALSHAVIARVLAKESGVKKDTEEIAGRVVSDCRAEAFSIARSAHLVAGIVAINLRGSCIPGCADVVQRIRSALHEHMEFI